MVTRLAIGIFLLAAACSEGVEPFEPIEMRTPGSEEPSGYPEDTALVDVHPASNALLLLVEKRSLVRLDLLSGRQSTLSRDIRWQGNARRRARFAAEGEAVVYRERDGAESDGQAPLRVHFKDGERVEFQPFDGGPIFEDSPRPERLAAFASSGQVTVFHLRSRTWQRFDVFADRVDIFDERVRPSLLALPVETIQFVDRAYLATFSEATVVVSQEETLAVPELQGAAFRLDRLPLARDEALCAVSEQRDLLRVDLETFDVAAQSGEFIGFAVAQGAWCLGLEEVRGGLRLTSLGADQVHRFAIPGRSSSQCALSERRGGAVVLDGCNLAVVDGRLVQAPFGRLFLGPPEAVIAREDVTGADFGIFLGQLDDSVGLSVWRWQSGRLRRTDFPKVQGACGFELVPSVEPDFVRWSGERNLRPRFEPRTIFLSAEGRYLRCDSTPGVDEARLFLGDPRGDREQPLTETPIETDLIGFAFSDRVLFHPDMTVVLDEAGAEPGRLRLRVFDHPRD